MEETRQLTQGREERETDEVKAIEGGCPGDEVKMTKGTFLLYSVQ